MAGRKTQTPAQIAACRVEMRAMAATWHALAARSEAKARADAEAQVFNQMAVALGGWFGPRLPGIEDHHAAPLHEVRLLALGVTSNASYFPSDASLAWQPETSITGYRAGDQIRLTEAVFTRLAAAYLDALAAEFEDA